ncbi:MAG: NAD-dependent epimerase/dehydratase family protein [Gemmatimonadota bacterium]
MIAVVTGSSGFIGSHLVEALLARGASVRALLRPDSVTGHRDPRVKCWHADLLDDRSVRESEVWRGATHVFHVGGVTKARTLAQFRDGNTIPTANILAALSARPSGSVRFILVSSQAAAGPAESPDRPVTEDDERKPIEAYGRSKGEAEDVTTRYSQSIPVTILRPGAVYGPRDVDFLNVFKQAVNRVAFHAASREQAMSVVYVRDLVEAILIAANARAAVGRTYFVAGEAPVTWGQIYALVAGFAGVQPIELQLPAAALWLAGQAGSLLSLLTGKGLLVNANKMALARPKWWLCDSSRIRRELGWSDAVSLQQGILETYLWYVNAGWLRPAAGGTSRNAANSEESV